VTAPCPPQRGLQGKAARAGVALLPGWRWSGRALLALACGLGLLAAQAQGMPDEPASQPAAEACPPNVPPVRSAGPARDRGMLWRLQRDGRTSYLYGTVHVGRPHWQRPGPRVAAALAASDTLALELDVDDPALMQQLNDAALAALDRAGVVPALSPALQQRLALAARRSCTPLVALAGLPPLMQAATLTLLDARWLGLDAAFGQERVLAAEARSRGRRILSLETLAQQTAALQPERPEDIEPQLADALRQLEDGSARRALVRLVDAWERGDLGFMERYEDWCECAPTYAEREQLKRLNDARNPQMAAGIVAEHASGRRVFAAVGALHMTGPAALPRLLQEQGFRVQRVDLSASRPGSPPGSPR